LNNDLLCHLFEPSKTRTFLLENSWNHFSIGWRMSWWLTMMIWVIWTTFRWNRSFGKFMEPYTLITFDNTLIVGVNWKMRRWNISFRKFMEPFSISWRMSWWLTMMIWVIWTTFWWNRSFRKFVRPVEFN